MRSTIGGELVIIVRLFVVVTARKNMRNVTVHMSTVVLENVSIPDH
jgi:hypothetical protein